MKKILTILNLEVENKSLQPLERYRLFLAFLDMVSVTKDKPTVSLCVGVDALVCATSELKKVRNLLS